MYDAPSFGVGVSFSRNNSAVNFHPLVINSIKFLALYIFLHPGVLPFIMNEKFTPRNVANFFSLASLSHMTIDTIFSIFRLVIMHHAYFHCTKDQNTQKLNQTGLSLSCNVLFSSLFKGTVTRIRANDGFVRMSRFLRVLEKVDIRGGRHSVLRYS